jgi:cytochrome c peroxidase
MESSSSAGFSSRELAGLRTFLDRASANCVACHEPPEFTDHLFHNVGVSQTEYDGLHGIDAMHDFTTPSFASLLGATPPPALTADHDHRDYADLGAWHVLSQFAAKSREIPPFWRDLLCKLHSNCGQSEMEAMAWASFKTPTLRNISRTAPYFHNGQAATLEDVVRFYRRSGALAAMGRIRNTDPELVSVRMETGRIDDLAAFLRTLEEPAAD